MGPRAASKELFCSVPSSSLCSDPVFTSHPSQGKFTQLGCEKEVWDVAPLQDPAHGPKHSLVGIFRYCSMGEWNLCTLRSPGTGMVRWNSSVDLLGTPDTLDIRQRWQQKK